MLTLAFDTSSQTVSVAILNDDKVLYETIINKDLHHSEVLLPTIDEACRFCGTTIRNIDMFACTLGPGSFTGLRIGLSTIKGFMMGTEKPAVGVSSLAALALNVAQRDKIIVSVMDAGRGQVYVCPFRYGEDNVLLPLDSEKTLDPHEMVDPYENGAIYVGEGAIRYAEVLRNIVKGRSDIASEDNQYICASAVGKLALQKYNNKEFLDVNQVVPVYLRSSDAVLPKQRLS